MKKEFNHEDTQLLKMYWQAFHMKDISIMPVTLPQVLSLKIMQERFISNKEYDKYDLFIPNNLK